MGKSPELRKKVTVVTFDLDEQAVEHIEKGRIDATVCQNPYEMGYQGVRLLKALVEKDEKTISEMLPNGSTVDRHGGPRDRPDARTRPSRATT